jgi:hypothetical protein
MGDGSHLYFIRPAEIHAPVGRHHIGGQAPNSFSGDNPAHKQNAGATQSSLILGNGGPTSSAQMKVQIEKNIR